MSSSLHQSRLNTTVSGCSSMTESSSGDTDKLACAATVVSNRFPSDPSDNGNFTDKSESTIYRMQIKFPLRLYPEEQIFIFSYMLSRRKHCSIFSRTISWSRVFRSFFLSDKMICIFIKKLLRNNLETQFSADKHALTEPGILD